ncbi:MAG: type I restriction enzyme HsdR N-terminal domain-containing protein [Bacteroidota bacterium]
MKWAFPIVELPIEQRDNQNWVYDPVRRDWYVLQKEEEVRQQLLHFFLSEKKVPRGLIAVEKEIRYNQMRKRFDVVIYGRDGKPFILCECKAPDVPLTPDTLNQIARYNAVIKAPHLLITNGLYYLFFSQNANGRYERVPSGWIAEKE